MQRYNGLMRCWQRPMYYEWRVVEVCRVYGVKFVKLSHDPTGYEFYINAHYSKGMGDDGLQILKVSLALSAPNIYVAPLGVWGYDPRWRLLVPPVFNLTFESQFEAKKKLFSHPTPRFSRSDGTP